MLVDANLLLFAVDAASPFHETVRGWLVARLNGNRRVGLPWQSLGAFLRLATNPRAFVRPLTSEEAWGQVRAWIEAPVAWIPEAGPSYGDILGQLITAHRINGNLIPDAMLAALAFEHGLAVCSADSDFARFPEILWENPLA